MKHKLLLLVYITIHAISCFAASDRDSISYIVRDSSQIKYLKGDILNIPIDAKNMREIFFYNDTIAIVCNNITDREPYMVNIYNTKNYSIVKRMFKAGDQPYEILSGFYSLKDGNLIINDINSCAIYSVDIDQALRDSLYKPLYIKSNANPYWDLDFINDTTLIGTSVHFFDFVTCDKKFNEGVNRYFTIDATKQNMQFDENMIRSRIFTGAFQKETLLISQKHNRAVFIANVLPEITIFDLNFNKTKTVIGPDKYSVEPYEQNRMLYSKSYPLSFTYAFKCENSFFLYNTRNTDGKSGKNPSEIIEMDWNGNVLNIYQLDRYIFSFSILNGYLYGIGLVDGSKTRQIIKYQLN